MEIFTKQALLPAARLEALKTEAACQLGQESGAFRAPQVLSLDESRGVIGFEKLEGLIPIRDLILTGYPALHSFLKRAGYALGVVHEQVSLPDEAKLPLANPWMEAPGQNVFVHGDFAGYNVCLSRQNEEVVIIDWSLAPYFEGPGTYGSRWLDLVWFVLYLAQGAARGAVGRWEPAALATSFLAGYQQRCALSRESLALGTRLLRRQYGRMAWYYCSAQRQRHGTVAALRHALFQVYLGLKFGCPLLGQGLEALVKPGAEERAAHPGRQPHLQIEGACSK